MSEVDQNLYQKVGELTRYIDSTVRQLDDTGTPIHTSIHQLPEANQHIVDLIHLTEEGTHTVIQLTEQMMDSHQTLANDLQEMSRVFAQTSSHATEHDWIERMQRILESDNRRLTEIITKMSFQDLLSQRLKKIMTILDEIQHRLLEIVVVFGLQQDGSPSPSDNKAEEMLKQLESTKATSLGQDTVNDILAEFGFN